MTWTVPVDEFPIPSENERLLYSAGHSIRHGSASIVSVATYNAAASYTEHVTPIVVNIGDASVEGTVQFRVFWQFNITAAGTCTSLTPRTYLGIYGASGNTGSIGSNVEIAGHTAHTGSPIATGWQSRDSGWVNVTALVTNLSTYGLVVAAPVFRLDTVGGNPTIARMSHSIFARVA